MFTGFGKGVLPFFLDLRFHNSKEFMDANRERYQKEVRAPFYAFIEALGPKMQLIDPDFEIRPAKCLSRINRDTRFSKDKSPYRDHLWVAFRQAAMDKDGLPFYWIEIRPESVNWGLGVWGDNRGMMDAMRRRMAAQPEAYLRLLPILQSRGFSLRGRDWKKMPVPEQLPEVLVPWYKKREVYAEKQSAAMEIIQRSDLVDRVYADFAALAPLYQAMRGCVEEAMNQLDEQGGKV